MRKIGSLPTESDAQLFSDYLYVTGIENKTGAAENIENRKQEWDIWVYSEDQIDKAMVLLKEYQSRPDEPKFREAAKTARNKRGQEHQNLEAYRKRLFTGRQIFPSYDRFGVLTAVLIGISVVVALISRLGHDNSAIRFLFITEYYGSGLSELRLGQIWRLITPIFIHFGFLHILFNMLWLRDLGSMIERRQSPWILAALVLVIAATSNLGQFLMSGPMFGGMSGVVYGLLGYVWMRGKHDPSSGLFVHPQTITMMIIWFFVCLLGLFGNIANTAHAVGFVTGIAWGYVSAGLANRRIIR